MWLRGDSCGIGPLRRELVDLYWQWENDLLAMAVSGRHTPTSIDERRTALDEQLRRSTNHASFTIYDLAEAEISPVGIAQLAIQARQPNAEFTIFLDRGERAEKICADATRLTLDYAFHITNLNNVSLTVPAPDVASIAAYGNAGFRRIGERRQSGYWLGRRVNEVLMDAIPEDFTFAGPSSVKRIIGQQNHDPGGR